MIARISSELHARLLALAAAEPGREVCGLVFGAKAETVRAEPVEGRAATDASRDTSFDCAQDERAGEANTPNSVRAERSRGTRAGARGTSLDCARDERIAELVPAANIAADPSDTFEIDPAALFAALKAERAGGPRVIGHYHSHPSGAPEPSVRDARQALDAGRLWLIVGAGRVAAWRAVPGGSIHGAFEPVTLLIAPDSCETGHTSPQGPARGA